MKCTLHVQGSLCSELYMFKVVCVLYCTVHVQGGLSSVLYMFKVVCVLYCTCSGWFE